MKGFSVILVIILILAPLAIHSVSSCSICWVTASSTPTDQANEYGLLTVDSLPSGAEVYIDGRLVGTTPLKNYRIPVGIHEVVVKKNAYVPAAYAVQIKANELKTLNVVLVPATGKLTVNSNPSGAEVYIDGKKVGTTPLRNYTIPEGIHEVAIRKAGYAERAYAISIKYGELKVLNVTLSPEMGKLTVKSNPSGAEVYVDGKKVGTTPLENYTVTAGTHEITLIKDGYQNFTKTVTVNPGEEASITAVLTPAKPSAQATASSGIPKTYILAGLLVLTVVGGIIVKSRGSKMETAQEENKATSSGPATGGIPSPSQPTPKYEALGTYLSKIKDDAVKLRFEEIEKIINAELPESAKKYRAWWGNDRTHSHAVRGWMNAGWRVKRVDLNSQIVEFERVEKTKLVAEEKPRPAPQKPTEAGSPRGVEKHAVSTPVPGFPTALLSRYEPLEFLGEGGFAKVFKVKRKKDGKIIALKIPRIDEKTSKTFIREVSTWLHLDHPNIVKLYDVDILPVPYLEMEYVEGVNLNGKTIRTLDGYPKPTDEETALNLIRGIAEGLKHAHSKGIYHRDLKPLNVLLKSNLAPKITDWGLAKLGTMSSSRSVMGYTPLYAAPEHLMPSKYGHTDARTDIWQLGVTFYELLTGKLPFEGYTYEEVFGKIVDENYHFTPPSKLKPELAKYDGVFEKLLAKKKEERYGSVNEFLKDLKKVEESEKRKAELERQVVELRRSLSESMSALKRSTSAEEIMKNRRLVVEALGKLALAYAELNNRAELLNTLNDLKFYTVQNLGDLSNAISAVELLIKENLPVGSDFIERLEVLVHEIKRENGA
ncbi:PEGA domain-containing protein [Thermococcus sp.]|uniref:PEGA domain-containing protein n=1 Tax=Thermococcus sp. TaxID=35749 RepID=UPI0026082DA8|nr:PEGA domain-containing protein [Thermococcus sp.]